MADAAPSASSLEVKTAQSSDDEDPNSPSLGRALTTPLTVMPDSQSPQNAAARRVSMGSPSSQKKRDEYGFELGEELSPQDMEQFQQYYGKVLDKRKKKWEHLLGKESGGKKGFLTSIRTRASPRARNNSVVRCAQCSQTLTPRAASVHECPEAIRCVQCGVSMPVEEVSMHECQNEHVVHLQRSETLKRYIRKGIPKALRPDVWMEVCGASELVEKHPDFYRDLTLQDLADPKVEEEIQKDLHRTFPDNEAFLCEYDETTNQRTDIKERIVQMQRVLRAFCIAHPKNGYCQGLNFLTGMLLIVTNDEEKTFWLLKQLTERILPDYYSKTMFAMRVDQNVIDRLVQMKMPALHKHLEDFGVSIALISTKWFICLFCDSLPTETVLRIWDSLLYEGPKIIFRVAVALFKRHEHKLMSFQDPGSCYEYAKSMTHKELDCHDLMVNGTFNPKVVGSFPLKTISKLRAEITKEMKPKRASIFKKK